MEKVEMETKTYRGAYLRLSAWLNESMDDLAVLDWALVGLCDGPHETGQEEFLQLSGSFSRLYDRAKKECEKVERQSEFLRKKLRAEEAEPQ